MSAEVVEVLAVAGPEAARSAAPAPDGLPSLLCHNSTGSLSDSQRKALVNLTRNVKWMAKEHGLERLLFGTLTPFPKIYEMKEAQKVFNSFATHFVRPRFPDCIVGVHRGKDGFLHFHFLLVAPPGVDVRAGFDHAAVDRGDYSSACEWLRAEWKAWREVTNYNGKRPDAAYPRIGRCELKPVKKNAESLARYLGGYLSKGIRQRVVGDRRARLIRYWGRSREFPPGVAIVSPRAWVCRAKIRQWAITKALCSSYEALREKYGRRWFWDNKEAIHSQVLTEYPSAAHAYADGHLMFRTMRDTPGAIRIAPPGTELLTSLVLESVEGVEKVVPVTLAVPVAAGATGMTLHQLSRSVGDEEHDDDGIKSAEPVCVASVSSWPDTAQIDENNPF